MHALPLVPLLFQICLGFTGRGLFYPGRTDLFELSIIHLNDFHARFEQTSPYSGTCRENHEKDCVGGFARVYTAVNQLVEERPNAIFLNAGDHFQGTLWYNIHRWNATAFFMNMLPHDAMTIGNHEFDNKIEGVVPFLKNVNAPVVVTNIDDSEEPTIQGLYKNSTIIERNGTKIGVIGVIASTTNLLSSTEKLKFLDEVETVNDEAKRLKEKGINIIIVLSHCGLDVDRIMAAKCPLIDVIVGGHSHTFLYSGPPPFIDTPEDEYPVVIKQNETDRTVLIVQAAAYTKYLGNLTVWFDDQGEVVDWDGNPLLLDHSIEEDPKILEALKPWKKVVDETALKKIGSTRVLLEHNCRNKECNMGNLITDAMVDAFVNDAENKTHWTYAAVACTNSGGIRTSLEESEITYGDLMMVQPFENTWDTVELTGESIREILKKEELLVWSGLKITYKKVKNTRTLVDVKIRCQACEYPRFENLVDDQWYRIVVANFLMNGGNGFNIFKDKGRNHKIGTLDIDHFIKYVAKMSPIFIGTERRIIIVK
ncbi:PREDICTED: apyrase isoform X2 [Wasmannia auropunctata]|nr:PREDICTED: apyrase isoform X2 [Wasmannia auropunctata]XP_011696073.1 PREDICTED: apyrase isoform X2 [Wasmannia auropunctata]XP_011696074.1 PREDICTED: apyrase isoform X2 [Wasmannia auropunctata]XP_011696075.1 PREDICTED: apyrase isoform X2 [Wasmannia auropunctata]XP_011696076.1 PREDICTED: apyrase isoform X2 [Wasmannia auropunctata]XP_011696077.1 PREDICTED: apyrase isoform X2 [Wasmannia auropunctata]